MKKKSLGELLKKLEDAQLKNDSNITDLSSMLSKKFLKGGYDTTNGLCSGSNNSCSNTFCAGTTNTSCSNQVCN